MKKNVNLRLIRAKPPLSILKVTRIVLCRLHVNIISNGTHLLRVKACVSTCIFFYIFFFYLFQLYSFTINDLPYKYN